MFTEEISYTAALIAGLLSFFTPCVLPLIPAYFTFITGFSLDELTSDDNSGIRRQVFFSTLSFVLGFSIVFILLGASASLLGGFAAQYQDWLRVIGGILILIFGIHITGLLKIKGLDFEKRIHLRSKPLHFFGSFVVGMAFGAGWSPCIGPILGSILILAGSQENIWQGIILLGIYSLGLAIPFVIISLFINSILSFLKRAKKVIKYINMVAGVLLILVGLLLITNNLQFLG
ncbi:Cytochrome c-type biogenesis protein CcdA [Candidatus Magnetomoraceae bacterium gMMP-1]